VKFHVYQEFTEFGYWVAAFNAWGAALRAENAKRDDMRTWCKEIYGAPGLVVDTSRPRWKDDIMWGEIRFRDKQDLTLFLLRWGK
jgi:hypothetical protein